MPLSRSGETPVFFEYAVKYALKSNEKVWPPDVDDFDPNPIKIPAYQRKIVWNKNDIKDFLESNSILFGIVILAQTPQEEQLVLLDGLQRFATATAILNYLYPLVLSDNPSMSDIAMDFKRLSAEIRSKQPIFSYNDWALKENTRIGISKSYKQLCKNVESVIGEGLQNNSKELANKIIKTFVNKQIAIDSYHGFKNVGEFTQTFININSTGIDLSEVDLLRSEIVQQAEKQCWDTEEIDSVENRFTEIFQSGTIKEAKVLGKNLYDALKYNPTTVFKNWHTLQKDDVEDLLNFIEQMHDAAKERNESGQIKWPYLYEIVECGHLPFTVTIWFLYKKMHLEGKTPNFLGGILDLSSDLHVLLRAFYRRLLDGSIGRIGPTVANFIQERDEIPATKILELAEKINPEVGNLDSAPDRIWLKSNLKKIGSKGRRIFNACLLPDRDCSGGNFHPLNYGYGNNQWVIDHLIPKAHVQKNQEGYEYIDQIVNLIPLRSNLSKKIKKYSCIDKMKRNYLYLEIIDRHPYVGWLINIHFKQYIKTKSVKNSSTYALDSVECLSNISDPQIGNERLEKLVDILETKL